MKIRTRLISFLLPIMISGTALIIFLLSFFWHQEILSNYKSKLKSLIITASAIESNKNTFQNNLLEKEYDNLKKELNIDDIYFIALKSPLNFKKIKEFSNDEKLFLNKNKLDFQNNIFSDQIMIFKSYKLKSHPEKIISAYSPVFDDQNNLIGYLSADMKTELINKKFAETILLLIFISISILISMIGSLFFIANKITRPVQKLNNSALALAAGNYNEKIETKGPKEIEELSNTLNIMSECLNENINRLKQNSIIKEKMYGEYECSILLQNHMLKKVIDECKSDIIAIDSINIFSSTPKGFLLDFLDSEIKDFLNIRVIEAKETGFEGMYQLLTNYKLFKENLSSLDHMFPITDLKLEKNTNTLNIGKTNFSYPIIYSQELNDFIEISNKVKLNPGNLFFIFNSGLLNFFKSDTEIKAILLKVLKYFSNDGLETVIDMLRKEILFTTKRKKIKEDLHLICFQILY